MTKIQTIPSKGTSEAFVSALSLATQGKKIKNHGSPFRGAGQKLRLARRT